MPQGGLLTTAWPRVFAHALILLTISVIWLVPHAQPTATAAARTRLLAAAVVTDPVPRPLEAMAARPRVLTSLPVAGSAFEQVQLPAPGKAKSPASARRGLLIAAVAPPAPPAPPPPPPPAPPTTRAGWGYDISWPQCDGATPGTPDVGVVGVTDGRPLTTNPCLSQEFAWASSNRFAGGAQLYVNLEIGGASDGPHHCATDDHPCRAFDYGWISMIDAMTRARQAGAHSSFWWLDVEVGNNWSDTPGLNAQTVRGAIDAAHTAGVDVGIYSSFDQWAEILPDSYHPGVPTWLAVVGDAPSAPGLCGPNGSLTGGPVFLVQYDDHTFDQDFICAAGAAHFADLARRHGH